MTWRSFLTDFDWYVHSVKASERRYLVARVRPQMTDEARTLISRWKASEFDRETGPALFIRKLAKSKLVRRPLKDANSMFGRYFDFNRRGGESIASVLVREAVIYEDFTEAVERLLAEDEARQEGKSLDDESVASTETRGSSQTSSRRGRRSKGDRGNDDDQDSRWQAQANVGAQARTWATRQRRPVQPPTPKARAGAPPDGDDDDGDDDGEDDLEKGADEGGEEDPEAEEDRLSRFSTLLRGTPMSMCAHT